MLTEAFIGRRPSHFKINSIVKSFIVSETFLWSAWNFVTPIFAIFAANHIPNGNAQVAASAFSAYLVTRVIVELVSGKFLAGVSDVKKILSIIFGMVLISFAYVGFAQTREIYQLYVFYSLAGMGLGIASPVKNSLFSTHLDKHEESVEWGIYDSVVFFGMALSAALGGFIATAYGFRPLFILASMINILGITPYLLYVYQDLDASRKQSYHHASSRPGRISLFWLMLTRIKGLSKNQTKKYLRGNWNVTIDQIISDFHLSKRGVFSLSTILENLEDDGWIVRSYCSKHKTYEYNPGERQASYEEK